MPEVKTKNVTEIKIPQQNLKVLLATLVKKVRVRFCAAAVDTRFLAVIGGEMDGEVPIIDG